MCVAEIANKIVDNCRADYVPANLVVTFVRWTTTVRDWDHVRDLALRSLRGPLTEGVIQIGLLHHGAFEPFSLEPEEALSILDRKWRELGRDRSLYELFWVRFAP